MLLTVQGRGGLSTDWLGQLAQAGSDRPSVLAGEKASRYFSNRFFLLVSSGSEAQAHKATEQLLSRLQISGRFSELVARVEPDWLEKIADFYYPYRYQLLPYPEQLLSVEETATALMEQAWQMLSSPAAGLVSSQQLINDPLFILPRYLQSLPKGWVNIQSSDGFLEVYQDHRYYMLVSGQLNGSIQARDNQRSALEVIDQAIAQTRAFGGSDIEVIRSGQLFQLDAGAEFYSQDVLLVGLGSLLVIMLLVLAVFRSLIPLWLCLLSTGTGTLAGYALTQALFGPVSLLTLVFGASLIGVSIDYAFYFLIYWHGPQADRPVRDRLRRILPGLTLGLLTSLLSYLPLLLMPFTTLRQVALFSVTGLLVAWLSVILVCPLVIRPDPTAPDLPRLAAWADGFLSFWQRWRSRYLLAVLALLSSGLLLLQAHDDIGQLQSLSSAQLAADQELRDIVGDFSESRFFLVKGDSPQTLLQNEEALVRLLAEPVERGDLKSFQALSEFLPSVAQQRRNSEKLAQIFTDQLPVFFSDLALTETAIEQARQSFAQAATRVMLPEDWLSGPLGHSHGCLWLGEIEGAYFSAVLLAGISPEWRPEAISAALDNVILVDRNGESAQLFSLYRVRMSWFLLVACVLIAGLLACRYGLAGGLRALLPPVLAGGLALSMLGMTGQPVNLFHILGLLIVLGVGVDYSLFLREARGGARRVFRAITLSAITTLFSFGLLALSNTAAISSFGLTVLTGLGLCYLLSPLAINPPGH